MNDDKKKKELTLADLQNVRGAAAAGAAAAGRKLAGSRVETGEGKSRSESNVG